MSAQPWQGLWTGRGAQLAALLLLIGGTACDGCHGCGDPPLAVLLAGQGQVQRDYASELDQWRPAEDGAEFQAGDGLRTGPDSRAIARVLGAGKVVLAPASAIRFRTGKRPGQDPTQVDLTAGEAVLEAGDEPLEFGTAMGKAVLEPGSRIRMTPGDGGTRFKVELGKAAFETDEGTVQVQAGEQITVGIGLALIEDEDTPPPPTQATADLGIADAAVPEASVVDAATPDEETSADLEAELVADDGDEPLAEEGGEAQAADGSSPALSPSLGYRDMTVPAGLTFRVYDPKPPTAIAFNLASRCRGKPGAIRLGQRAYQGDRTVTLPVGPGMHAYSAHCVERGQLGKQVAKGRVRVLRSAGARQIAKSAPRSKVDADGRHYTVMYQSKMPAIQVRWPRAPKASEYVLYIKSGGKQRTVKTRRPMAVLKSGSLAEGVHKVFFMGKGTGGKRSKETTIKVAFDNAAPTVQITEPKPVGGFKPGQTVTVAGFAVPGSQVSLFSKRLRLDKQHRFSGSVATSGAQRAVVLRFKSLRHGVRYYLRRAAGLD